ncbi:CPBP family glutamic-type intramembrane protease [Peribacillus simplex]|uniref:CPBP family glutamic-type intramembrane protease n=1 Tax=Peribacillus simplex TaxID=1478 RepID=UPI003D27AD99
MSKTEESLPTTSDTVHIATYKRVLSHLILVVMFSLLGAVLAPKVDLVGAFLFKIMSGQFIYINFQAVINTGLKYGFFCGIGNLIFYYFYLKKKINLDDFMKIEGHYQRMGAVTRIFYGGFVEEIIFRWGFMTLFIWIGGLIWGDFSNFILISAISISSILFALVHVPSIKMVGVTPSLHIYTYTLLGNFWVGIFCGLAYWKQGILASIIVHILFHTIWLPVQYFLWNRVRNN